jgi:hypothetical protein
MSISMRADLERKRKMKIAKLIFLCVVGIAIQTEGSCTQTRSSECEEFFVKSIEEQDAVFRTLQLEKQLEVYRCGMNRRPPTIGLAHEIAKSGEKIIPELTVALQSEKDEWMQSALIEIFRVMSVKGYLRGKRSTIDEIRTTVSRMKVSRIKKEAQASLNEIEANAANSGT